MLSQAQSFFMTTKQLLPKGAANLPDAKTGQYNAETSHYTIFHQEIGQYILYNLDKPFTPLQKEVSNLVLTAILAELYQCGNCTEQAAVTYYQYIKAGVPVPLEILFVHGLIQAGITADGFMIGQPADHSVLVVNRKKETDSFYPHLWNENVVINDPWANILDYCEADRKPTVAHIMGRYLFGIIATTSFGRLEGTLVDKDWQIIIDYLSKAKEMITLPLVKSLLQVSCLTNLNAEQELNKIHQKIAAEIKVCEKFSVPTTNPSPTNSDEKSDTSEKRDSINTASSYSPCMFQAEPIQNKSTSITPTSEIIQNLKNPNPQRRHSI